MKLTFLGSFFIHQKDIISVIPPYVASFEIYFETQICFLATWQPSHRSEFLQKDNIIWMYEEEPLFLLSDTYVKDFSYLIFFQWSGSREDIWPTLQPILHWEEEESSSSFLLHHIYQNFNIPFREELFRKRTLSSSVPEKTVYSFNQKV